MSLPEEIINIIFSYMQGSSNKIMKKHISDVEPYYKENCRLSLYPHSKERHLRIMMQISNAYGFKQFNSRKFKRAYYRCDGCFEVLSKDIIEDRGHKFCSEFCMIIFDED